MGGSYLALLFISWVKAILKCFCDDAPCNSVALLWLEVVIFAICITPDGSDTIFNPAVNLLREGFLVLLNTLPDFLDLWDSKHFFNLALCIFGSLMFAIRLVA